jgi:uncharacterized OB-fold protein
MGETVLDTFRDDAPNQRNDAAGFWDAAAEGRLRIRHCTGCNASHHYPRAVCPFCGSQDLEWRDCAGMGEIYSVTVTRYVTLPEGVTILTRILDAGDDPPRIGDAVKAVFREQGDGRHLPFFVKANSAQEEM